MVLRYLIIVRTCSMQNNLHDDLIVPFKSTRIMYLFSLMKTLILTKYAKNSEKCGYDRQYNSTYENCYNSFNPQFFSQKTLQNIFLLYEFHVLGSTFGSCIKFG